MYLKKTVLACLLVMMTFSCIAEDSLFDINGLYYDQVYDRNLVGYDFLKAGARLSHFNSIEKSRYDSLAKIYFDTSQAIEDKTKYRNAMLDIIKKTMDVNDLYKATRDADLVAIAKTKGKEVVSSNINNMINALPLSFSEESKSVLVTQMSDVINLVIYDVILEKEASKKLEAATKSISEKILFAGINLGGLLAEIKAHSQHRSALLSIDFLQEFYRCNSSFECVRTRNSIDKRFFWDSLSQQIKHEYIISEYTILQEEKRNGKFVPLRSEFYDEIFKTISFIDSYIDGRFGVYLESKKPVPAEPSEPIVYALNIGRVGEGSVISTNSLVLDCGTDCNGYFEESSDVILEATANDGYLFSKWIGDCAETANSCTVAMNKSHTIFAVFEEIPPPIARNILVNKVGLGSIISSAGIDCGSDCYESFDSDTTITLSAVPNSGFYFKGWDDASCTGTGNCSILVNESRYIRAIFEPCVSIDHLWQKASPLYAGATNNFDAQFKISNQCSTTQLFDNAVIALHHVDTHVFYKTCYENGTLDLAANDSFDTGIQFCTVIDAGEYELIAKTHTALNGWVNLDVQKVNFLPGNQPATPTQPTATDGIYSDKVNITWPSVIDATSYKIYRCPTFSEIGCIQVGSSSTTNYIDTSGVANIEYYYRIKANHITGGDSDFSSSDLGYRLGLITFPPPPNAVTASDGIFVDKVNVTWTATAEANSYLIYRCSNTSVDSCISIKGQSGTSYDDFAGLGSQIYYYRVKSVNDSGNSADYSDYNLGYRSGALTTLPKPAKPNATDGTFTDKVSISWTTASGASSYNVYRCENSYEASCNHLITVNVTNYDDTTGIAGTTYHYRIMASNGNGDSLVSGADSGYRTNTTSTPSTPGKPDASDGTYLDKVRITWFAVTGATSYTVYRCSNSLISSCLDLTTTTSTSYDDAGILPGSTYFYRIKSNGSSTSDFSSYDAGYLSTSASVPSPGSPSATDGTFLDKIVVSWQPVSGDDPIYQVYRCTSTSTSSCLKLKNVSGTSINDRDSDGVKRNTTYYYRVKTLSNTSVSEFSNYDAGYLGNETATPQKPTASYGTYGDRIHVSWAQVTGATEYRLYACEIATNNVDGTPGCYLTHPGQQLTSTEYDHTEQYTAAGQHLFYHVKADNGFGGWTAFSGCCSVGYRSVAVPEIPSSVSAEDGYTKDYIKVTASKVDGAKGYEFYRCWNELVDSCALAVATTQDKSFFEDYDAGYATYFYRVKSIGHNGTSDFSSYDAGYKKKGTILQPSLIARLDTTSTDINQLSHDASSFAKEISKFGDFALVGKVLDADNTGSAYIFQRQTNGNWTSVAKLLASDGKAWDSFGYDVLLSDKYAIVKALVGKVYIFEHQPDNSWAEVSILAPNDGGSFSGKGPIDLLGDRLLIGAKNDNPAGTNSGSVYIFERQTSGLWVQVDKLVASDAGEGDYFGGNLSQSQNRIVVGVRSKDSFDDGEESGAVYIFELNEKTNSWIETIKLEADDASAFMHFGDAVEISGDLLAITSRYYNSADNLYPPSSVDVFEYSNDGAWHKVARLSASDGTDNNEFGRKIAVFPSENKILVGAPYADTSINNSGAAYLFSKDIFGSWHQSNKFTPDDSSIGIQKFSYTMSIEGNQVILGAPTSFDYIDNGSDWVNKGFAYLYELPSEPLINIIRKNALTTSELGRSVSFGITLNSKPTANVVINLSSSNLNEGTISTPSLTFTSDNWYTPQSITVTGVNDNVLDGDKHYSVIISPASSADNNYDGLNSTDIGLINKEEGLPLAISIIGKGSVVSNPVGVDCNNNCTIFLNENMNVSLTAIPTSGYEFTGWTSAGCSGASACSLTMNQAHNLVAGFKAIEQQLHITVSEKGKVTSFPYGIDCGLDCNEKFTEGMQVILYAQPELGYTFLGWGGSGCNTENPCLVTMDQVQNISSNFAIILDFDNDGLPGLWEIDNGTNPLIPDANGDLDGDGWTNLAEYQAGRRANINESAIIPMLTMPKTTKKKGRQLILDILPALMKSRQ